jgi:hypothetical protein
VKSVDARPAPVEQHPGTTGLAVGLPQHPDEHRPERPIPLAVDQELRPESQGSPGLCRLRLGPIQPTAVAVRRGLPVRSVAGRDRMLNGSCDPVRPMWSRSPRLAIGPISSQQTVSRSDPRPPTR